MKTIKDFDLKNKKVLVRCDFNIPLNKNSGKEADFRIKESLKTIKYLSQKKAKTILMSHLGNPNGKIVKKLSLNIVKKKLNLLSGLPIKKASDCIGENVKKKIGKMKEGDILLLENLRFNKGEEKNNLKFAKELSSLGELYINDAFGACHRSHASIALLPKLLPSGAGFLLEKEVKILSQILENSKRPLVAIIGGAKIESKSKVIDSFLKIADSVLIGGKIAFVPVLKNGSFSNLILAKDDNDGNDIGNNSIKEFCNIIKKAKTIAWAGPVGIFEDKRYEKGTKLIAKEISKNKKAFKVAGGGDTIAAISKFNLQKGFDHLSTGGGAMLTFLGKEELPGLKALNYYAKKRN